MREKTIEQKFRAAVKAAGGLAVKFTSPVLMGCLTVWHFSLVGGWHLWKSRPQGKSPAPCSWHGTGCCGSWDLKCMCWMTSRRSEG